MLTAFILLALIAFYLFLYRPKALEVKDLVGETESKQERLMESGWPLDPERLEKLLAGIEKDLSVFRTRSDEIFAKATSMFEERINLIYGNSETFQNQISRLEYQSEYQQIASDLLGQGVVLSESVLKLGETTPSPYTYRLMLQLWTVDLVSKLTLESGLKIVEDSSVVVVTDNGKRNASKITVLPVRTYYMTPEKKGPPYALEMPVRVTVKGTVGELCNLLGALHQDERFVPVSRLEVQKPTPSRKKPAFDQIEAVLECSCFFNLGEDAKPVVVPTGKNKPLPRGA